MTHRAGMAAFALLAMTACDGPAPSPAPPQAIRPLSATDPAGNAVRIAAFLRQQCVEQIRNKVTFEEGLRASGWSTHEILVNANSRRGLVGSYEFTGGFISAMFDARGGNCLMAVDAPLAAPFEPLREVLSGFGGRPTPGSRPGTARWQWSGALGYDYSMELTPGTGTDPTRINVSVTGPAQRSRP